MESLITQAIPNRLAYFDLQSFDMSPVTTEPGRELFLITDRGGTSTASTGGSEITSVGYGRISPDLTTTTPSGLAIFGYTQDGVLVSEAGVPARAPLNGGRIFAEVNGPVNTGLAIANPNATDAVVAFYFTDVSGPNFGSGSVTLGANQQMSSFLNEAPFNGGASILGTFTFTSSVPVAVIALRGFTNERSEFLVTTLPVASLSPDSATRRYFPHFADGGGWTTEIILVNPGDQAMTGLVAFYEQSSGTATAGLVTLALDDGSIGSSFNYSIPPRSSQRFTTSNPAGSTLVGSIRAVADMGTTAPAGLVVFSYTFGGVTVAEAGVPALPPASAFRIYAEGAGTPGADGSIRSGLAIMDVGGNLNTATLELTNLDGAIVGPATALSIPPGGQVASFLDELFTLPDDFRGVLRVTTSAEASIIGLRARTNQRSDFLITTTPPTIETAPTTTSDLFFPHIADAGGWSTRFVLFSGSAGQSSSGSLSFVDQEGQALDLALEP
jgi:hypothetical protein